MDGPNQICFCWSLLIPLGFAVVVAMQKYTMASGRERQRRMNEESLQNARAKIQARKLGATKPPTVGEKE